MVFALVLAGVVCAAYITSTAYAQQRRAGESLWALAGRKIVVDAGHGGFDPGASGIRTGVAEQGINLDIAGKLKSLLEEYGAVVVMTREDENAVASTKEEDMHTRERIIREAAADAVLSVHHNRYSDTSVRGPQVFFFRAGTPAQRLADCVQRALNDGLAPAKKRSAQSADYLLLRAGAAPCITVECAFLSNPDDEALLQSDAYREKIARCIAQGVSEFFLQDRSIAV